MCLDLSGVPYRRIGWIYSGESIPMHRVRKPITNIDPQIIKALRDIAYQSEEAVIRELTSSQMSTAKVCYTIYTRQDSIQQLPSVCVRLAKSQKSMEIFQGRLR
jgi:hypothetical protein